MSWYDLIEKYSWIRHIYNRVQYVKNGFISDYEPHNKVFVIGLNKTGTTSIEEALRELGYRLGNQADAEILNEYVTKGKYEFLYKYIKTANAFQDVPFSLRNVYKLVYKEYPNAKFILTVRNNEDQWFSSLKNFTKKRFSTMGISVDTELQLNDTKMLRYRYKNMPYNNCRNIWHGDKKICFDTDPLFDEDYCKYYYLKHIKEAKEFFKDKGNLLIINVENGESYKQLCDFLGREPLHDTFPHLNKT
ncbi:sulfotransferase family protein [Francisella philomiragia]|uniref:sulfotransferase family protein n=1 Tax=Francisella philomiragia TaxID=28110 RepID=UPI0035149A31